MSSNISLNLASRQKRLKYWNERFFAEDLSPELKKTLSDYFLQYETSISQIAVSAEPSSETEAFATLDNIERELESLFRSFRMLTSEMGVHSVTDDSTRGKGGSISE